eukprot:COSAG02_NODE_2843_length_7905_cov_95.905842_3_plen_179_part_00
MGRGGGVISAASVLFPRSLGQYELVASHSSETAIPESSRNGERRWPRSDLSCRYARKFAARMRRVKCAPSGVPKSCEQMTAKGRQGTQDAVSLDAGRRSRDRSTRGRCVVCPGAILDSAGGSLSIAPPRRPCPPHSSVAASRSARRTLAPARHRPSALAPLKLMKNSPTAPSGHFRRK